MRTLWRRRFGLRYARTPRNCRKSRHGPGEYRVRAAGEADSSRRRGNSSSQARLQKADLDALHRRAQEDHVGFWADLARQELHWHRPFSVAFDDSKAPNFSWFTDGMLNVSHNCLDVHLAERGHKTAIEFEGEPGDTRKLSYRRAARRSLPVRECAARAGRAARRPRRHLHAARAGDRRRDARVRAHRRDSFCRVRRVLGAVAEGSHRGRGREAAHHCRRRLARRQGDRAEGRGGQGARCRMSDDRARHRLQAHRRTR